MQDNWDPAWENVFLSQEWGKYPDLEVVRFVARNFYHLSPRENVHLLDLGCGPGANTWYMAREGFLVSAIDGSPAAIQQLQDRLTAEKLSVHTSIGDISHLPYPDASFDGVIDCECLYANPYTSTATILDEVCRVLKPNGKLLSIAFSSNSWGYGDGPRIPGEKQSFRFIASGPFANKGCVRFTSEEDIQELYGARFTVTGLEYVKRSTENRKQAIEEWIVSCVKTYR